MNITYTMVHLYVNESLYKGLLQNIFNRNQNHKQKK